MKVSYIILPFEDPTYLVRCVNSLYRQLGEDFEVILAENDFGYKQEEIEEFLDEKAQVKRIAVQEISNKERKNEAPIKLPYTEKLARAISLISSDSSYVMLINVDTVVSPVCAKDILKCENSDLIIPAAAVKKGNDFVLDSPEITDLKKNFDQYLPQRFCFGKELFAEFKPEYAENFKTFSFFLLKALVKEINITVIEDVVAYVQPFSTLEQSENVDFDIFKEQSEYIISSLNKIDDKEMKVSVFEKAVISVFDILNDNEKTENQEAYEILMSYCKEIKDDLLLKRVFEGTTGFETEELLQLDHEQFTVYRNRVKGSSNPATVDFREQNKLLKDMRTALDVTKKELTDLKKDVSAIKAKPFTVAMPAAATGTVISDPYTDIPQMYREGRLGLKTIIRSFNGWLKYKTGRKK